MQSPVSAIIIINPNWFDAISLLPQALSSIEWCDEIVIATSDVTPQLQSIAKQFKAKLIPQSGSDFSAWRYHASESARHNWLLYLDADETVPTALHEEINQIIDNSPDHSAYAIPRLNFIFNHPMHYGGWWPDYVVRLINKSHLLGYHGEVHEQPKLSGSIGYTKNHFNHYKHQKMEDMVAKTQVWSSTESLLFFQSHHPPMKSFRFIRPFVTEVFSRLVIKQGYRDGIVGWIDAIYQGYSRLITYTKLWELQQNSNTK